MVISVLSGLAILTTESLLPLSIVVMMTFVLTNTVIPKMVVYILHMFAVIMMYALTINVLLNADAISLKLAVMIMMSVQRITVWTVVNTTPFLATMIMNVQLIVVFKKKAVHTPRLFAMIMINVPLIDAVL